VRRGVGEHVLHVRAAALLADAAALGLAAKAGEALDQLVAGALQLLDARHPSDRHRRCDSLGSRPAPVVPRVGGELGLDPGDLRAQLAAKGRCAGVGVQRGKGGIGKAAATRGSARRPDGRGELGEVDAGVPGVLDRLFGDLVDLPQLSGALGHVGAATVLGGDQLLMFERQIGGASRVHVDPGELGQLADAGQPVPAAQGPAHDHRPQLPAQLRADGQLGIAVDREVDHRGALELVLGQRQLAQRGVGGARQLCHYRDTVSPHPY